MSRFVQIAPVPPTTTVSQIKQIFHIFLLEKICVQRQIAYLQFQDANDIETLDFIFPDHKVSKLLNAAITILPPNFQMPHNPEHKYFQNSIEKQKKINSNNAGKKNESILVISKCDQDALFKLDRQSIKKQYFQSFSTKRIQKWNRDLYVQFTSGQELSRFRKESINMDFIHLGSQCRIEQVDQNFDFGLIDQILSKNDEERHRKREQIQKMHQLKEKATQKLIQSTLGKKLEEEIQGSHPQQIQSHSIVIFWGVVTISMTVYTLIV